MPESTGEFNYLAQQKYGRMFGALTPEERETLTSPGYDRPLTEEEEAIMEPPAINRLDPLWVAISAAALSYYLNEDFNVMDRVDNAADHADAMIRERDRRDREERP